LKRWTLQFIPHFLENLINLQSKLDSIADNQDIALRDLFLKIQEHIRNLLGSWKLISLCGFLLAFLLLALNFSKPRLYKADLNFMVNEEEESALGGISAILGQFGLGGAGTESNLDKIIELSRARTITKDALFSKSTIDNKEDFLANHLIGKLEKSDDWEDGKLLGFLSQDSLDLENFRFAHADFEKFSILENKALKRMHQLMVGKEMKGGFFQSNYSELSGIMSFSMTSPDPMLSIETVNNLFAKLSEYYLNKKTVKQEKDFLLIKSKYDSIQSELDSKMYKIAKFEDENKGLIRKQDAFLLKKMKADEFKLGEMLGEAEKQYQIAQLTMERQSEYVQVIDRPLLPLKPVNKGKLYYFLLGGLLGGLLSSAYVVFRKMYSDIMSGS